MTWEEKFEAMKALLGGNISLRMRKPGDWYVEASGRHVGGDGVLSGNYGNGSTPEEAVLQDWEKNVTNLPNDKYVVLSYPNIGPTDPKKYYRWNGFMWKEFLVERES